MMRKTAERARNRRKLERVNEADRELNQALAEAERFFRRAVTRYEKAVPVVCNARIDSAAKSLRESGGMVAQALSVLARSVCRHLRLKQTDAVERLCRVLRDAGILERSADSDTSGMLAHVLDHLPRRDQFDEWLCGNGRTLLDALTRAGRLDPASDEYRRMQKMVRSVLSFDAARPPRDAWRRKPTPLPRDHARGTARAEKDLAQAERLMQQAETLGRAAERVLCTPANRQAERNACRAADLAVQAMSITRRHAVERLGLPGDTPGLYEQVFVDQASHDLIGQIGYARTSTDYMVNAHVPKRGVLIDDVFNLPRAQVRAAAHVARLPKGSDELRNLRAALKLPPDRPDTSVAGRRRGGAPKAAAAKK